MKLTIPSTPPIPLELLAQALASLGLVLDSRREPDGTHHAIWASDAALLSEAGRKGERTQLRKVGG